VLGSHVTSFAFALYMCRIVYYHLGTSSFVVIDYLSVVSFQPHGVLICFVCINDVIVFVSLQL